MNTVSRYFATGIGAHLSLVSRRAVAHRASRGGLGQVSECAAAVDMDNISIRMIAEAVETGPQCTDGKEGRSGRSAIQVKNFVVNH